MMFDKLAPQHPEPAEKGHGVAHICPLSLDGKLVKLILGSIDVPLRIPFEAVSHNSDDVSSRVNHCLEILDQNQRLLEALYSIILELITARANEVFKKPVAATQIRLMLKPSLTTATNYQPTLNTNNETREDDAMAVNVWNGEGNRLTYHLSCGTDK